ncbi:MAG: 2OG-Fe(II) oxygenase family protein [Pseudomonadota bacterium]|nr:2OG-Fe(II) oxygenase family protein [Pseudomonadota bacterium]
MIDTIPFDAPDAPARFARTLRQTGFAVLSRHPLQAAGLKRFYAAWAAFFAGPEKDAWRFDPAGQTGWFPYRTENARDSRQKDLKEFFHVYRHAPVPAGPEVDTRRVHAGLIALGETLLDWLDRETPADIAGRLSMPLREMVRGSDRHLLRILHYPPLPEAVEAGAVRAAAHEDINLITLLLTGSEPGLQARDRDGGWHDVPCDAGLVTVNAGDMLSRATGGYFPSTTHRVMNPVDAANRSRYSMPLFMHARAEVPIAPGITADDYLQERLREIGLA